LVPDRAPLTRMTAEQYQNTVRDLFAPVDMGTLTFPVELEGPGGFENDDALGRWRDTDNRYPVDASGELGMEWFNE
jgi:hypothetical protein